MAASPEGDEVEVRSFRRSDRQQLTALVNAHVAAVIPGVSLSVASVMSNLERDPGEFVVDPWVAERLTLVAEQRQRIVAAAHVLRYGSHDRVGETYRDAGEIRWLLCWPAMPRWPDAPEAGDQLAQACLAQLDRWGVRRRYADGTLPVPAVYGVPEQWPHIREIYERAGFKPDGGTKIVFVAAVGNVPRWRPSLSGLNIRRTLGVNGTRIWALSADTVVGFIEVDTNLGEANRAAGIAAWADVGNLEVVDAYRRQGVGSWLVAEAAGWLELAGINRLLGHASTDDTMCVDFLERLSFRELTRTIRGYELT
ncbi:MAG TPA: GNAT family N-acetyltransferase [Jiangellaceae bacterium]|nr:GNAT family N-acetyltransferase [Jiangellaceae bacterium]